MTLDRIVDWHPDALAYLEWCLDSHRLVSAAVMRARCIYKGAFEAYVPHGGSVTSFRQGAGSSVNDCVRAIADLCEKFLERRGRAVVFEQYLLEASKAHEYRLTNVALVGNDVIQIARSGASNEEIQAIVRDWNVLPIFNAFLVDEREHLEAATFSDQVVTHLRAIIAGAYDGEGFLLWRRFGL